MIKLRTVLFAAATAMALYGAPAFAAPQNAPSGTLQAFHSDEELRRFLSERKKLVMRRAAEAVPAPPPAASLDSSAAPAEPAAAAPEQQSITNTQEANVDEGGIVKMHGSTLVILRRGRLFTVETRGNELRPIDAIDAYPPGANVGGDWYDEMLVSGDRVIVIGYSYGRGGTEINRFRIDRGGRLEYEDSYHLRSNDYYSSRNYASRLIGTKLIVYSPLYLPYGDADLADWLPALQRWNGQSDRSGFGRIVAARNIYIPRQWQDPEEGGIDALHTVTSCDLDADELRCDATSVMGPMGRTFYVSSHAVYVWVTNFRYGRSEGPNQASMLYRLPLDGSAPSAIGVQGGPIDQFSFREDWDDGMLNVLVRSEGGGDAMWLPEFTGGTLALLRMPLRQFGDGDDKAARSFYRTLPKLEGDSYSLQNRFVGDYVLYGAGNSWGAPQGRQGKLVLANVRTGNAREMRLEHGVDRIEAMGRDAVVVGADAKNLNFSAVELTDGLSPKLGDRYVLEGAAQGETRSHAFFFKPEREPGDEAAGVLGLPVAHAGRPGYEQLTRTSASILFLRRADRQFAKLGELWAEDRAVTNDGCKASCVDWYGNSRPIFLGNRTFALMGYEIVEGERTETRIRETRRISFAPGARNDARE